MFKLGKKIPQETAPVGIGSPIGLPPIKVKKRRLSGKQIGGLVVIVLAIGWYYRKQKVASEADHAIVLVGQVTRGDVRQTVSATGVLTPFSTIDVKSRAGGTVLKMAVEEGTVVKKGQLIALIDKQDTAEAYESAVADLNAAKAGLIQAKQNEQLQNASIGPQIAQSKEGVSSAQTKLIQAQQNLQIEKASAGPQVSQAAEALDTARIKLQQAQDDLVVQRPTTINAIADARQNLKGAEARLQQAVTTAKAQPALTQSAIDQAQAGVDAANANVTSARETLAQLQTSTFLQEQASAQAAVDQANSDVTTAQTNLNRDQQLLDKGFIAQNLVDAAQNALVTAQSSLRTNQSHLDTLKTDQAARLNDSQARVVSSQGSLNQAEAALASARTNIIQNSLRQKDVVAARSAALQAQAALNTAVANERQIPIKEADVKSAVSAVHSAQAALTVAVANSETVGVRANDVLAGESAVRQAQAALKAAQANIILSSVRHQDVATAQAKLTGAQVTANDDYENLQQTRVVAPRDGIILQKYVDEGTIIQSGQSGFTGGTAIVQLANMSVVYVDVSVDEADVALIEPGQKVDITLDAYPNSPKSGTVRKIYPLAVTTQNVTYVHVQVQVDPMDVDSRLRSQMNATCSFLVDDKPDTLMVPSEAVKDDEDVSTVTVIKDPKKPAWLPSNQEVRNVEVGLRGDDNTEILSGLKEGETVATQIIAPVAEATPAAGLNARGGGGGRGGGR